MEQNRTGGSAGAYRSAHCFGRIELCVAPLTE